MSVLLVKDGNLQNVPLSAQQAVDESLVIVHLPASLVNDVAQPVGPSQPLPVYNPGNVVSADSGTITTGGTAQNLFGGVTPTNGYQFSNLNASGGRTLFIDDVGTASASGTSVPVLPQTTYVTPSGYKPPGLVTVFGTTNGDAYSARRW